MGGYDGYGNFQYNHNRNNAAYLGQYGSGYDGQGQGYEGYDAYVRQCSAGSYGSYG